MRKILSRILTIILIIGLIIPTSLPVISKAITGKNDSRFQYTINPDGKSIIITRYVGTDTEVVIPNSIDGYKVTRIGYEAFDNCESLISIDIPSGVTTIDAFAFEKCINLTSITIPNSVTDITGEAFIGCKKLETIKVDKDNMKYKSIDGVLYNIWSLGMTLVCYPAGKTNQQYTIRDNEIIGRLAFYDCGKLEKIEVDENNAYYKSIDGILYSKDSQNEIRLIRYPAGKVNEHYTISNEATIIEEYAFNDCTSLTNITIPNSVKTIRTGAFCGCSSLTNITIPNSVSTIGIGSFRDCVDLTNITIPDSVTAIETSAFSGCTSLANITVPNSVTSIGESAFWGCSSLTSITIPSGVAKIEEHAFSKCTSLANITVPNSVTSIGESAFWGCSSLTSITIPNSVTAIGQYAFLLCPNLTIICERDSVAHKYAVENKIKYKLIGENETITSIDYAIDETNNLVTNIKPNTGIEEIKAKLITNEEYEILTKGGQVVKDEKIGTGMKIKFKTGKVYEIVVQGDANGDGKMSTTDITKLKKHIIQKENLEGCYGKAVDINNDGKTSVTDLAKMKKVLVGLDTL